MLRNFNVTLDAYITVIDVLAFQTDRISHKGVLRGWFHTKQTRLQWIIRILVEVSGAACLRLCIISFWRICFPLTPLFHGKLLKSVLCTELSIELGLSERTLQSLPKLWVLTCLTEQLISLVYQKHQFLTDRLVVLSDLFHIPVQTLNLLLVLFNLKCERVNWVSLYLNQILVCQFRQRFQKSVHGLVSQV